MLVVSVQQWSEELRTEGMVDVHRTVVMHVKLKCTNGKRNVTSAHCTQLNHGSVLPDIKFQQNDLLTQL